MGRDVFVSSRGETRLGGAACLYGQKHWRNEAIYVPDVICFCRKEQLRGSRSRNSSRLAGIERLYGNFRPVDEIPATDIGISPRRDGSGII